jgi:hypothetical protein
LPEYLFSPWGIVAVVSLLALLLVVPVSIYLRRAADARRVQMLVEKYSSSMIKDAVIPDGIDGFAFADYLMRIGNSVHVLNVESKKGYIFGAPNIDEWTCIENKRTEKFMNPLKRATLFAQQCKHIGECDNVGVHVLFGRESKFPKGVPEGVIRMAEFESSLAVLQNAAQDQGSDQGDDQVWMKLVATTQSAKDQVDAEL